MRRYLWVYALVASLSLLAVAAFNLSMDPFDVYHVAKIAGINREKYLDSSRQHKSLALRVPHYKGLILGTSRSQTGFSPAHEVFGGEPAYNGSLPAATVYEQRAVFRYALEHQPLRTVVVGLDIDAYPLKPKFAHEYRFSAFNRKRRDPMGWRHFILSYAATSKSVETLTLNLLGVPPRFRDGQYVDTRYLERRIREVGQAGLFARWAPHESPRQQVELPNYTRPMAELDAMISECERRGIDIRLAIVPHHAVSQELRYRKMGGADLEAWKRHLVRVAYDPKRRTAVPLYDFSGFTGPVAESIPGSTDRTTQMRWHREASHFKSELGDLVLDRLFGHRQPGREVPRGFGVLLTPDTIESHLAQQHADRERYLAEHGHEIAMIVRIAATGEAR